MTTLFDKFPWSRHICEVYFTAKNVNLQDHGNDDLLYASFPLWTGSYAKYSSFPLWIFTKCFLKSEYIQHDADMTKCDSFFTDFFPTFFFPSTETWN